MRFSNELYLAIYINPSGNLYFRPRDQKIQKLHNTQNYYPINIFKGKHSLISPIVAVGKHMHHQTHKCLT